MAVGCLLTMTRAEMCLYESELRTGCRIFKTFLLCCWNVDRASTSITLGFSTLSDLLPQSFAFSTRVQRQRRNSPAHCRSRSSRALCDFCTCVLWGKHWHGVQIYTLGNESTLIMPLFALQIQTWQQLKNWKTPGSCFVLDLFRAGSIHTVPFCFFFLFFSCCHVLVTLQAALSVNSPPVFCVIYLLFWQNSDVCLLIFCVIPRLSSAIVPHNHPVIYFSAWGPAN